MRRFFLHKLTACALLAYFALFVVPPVSSFASEDVMPPAAQDRAFSVRRPGACRQAQQFLFDLIVWQQFKKTKQSALSSALAVVAASRLDAAPPARFLPAAVPAAPALTGPGEWFAPPHRVRSSLIVFSRSDSSPPAPLL